MDNAISNKFQEYIMYINALLGNQSILKINKILLPFIKSIIILTQEAFIINRKQTSIIHYWDKSTITIYCPIKKQKYSVFINKPINSFADSVAWRDRIFIMGGNLVSDVYEVRLNSKTLKLKKPMIFKKFFHSLCSNNGYIYSIGGRNEYEYLADCEKYCIRSGNWIVAPNLINARIGAAIFIFCCRYLFCVGGSDKADYARSIEKLDTAKMGKWENVSFNNLPSDRCFLHGIQMNDSNAIIFGGYNNKDKLNDSYVMNLTGDKIDFVRTANLMCAGIFGYTSSPQIVNGVVYSVDNGRNIHLYNNNTWKLIPY